MPSACLPLCSPLSPTTRQAGKAPCQPITRIKPEWVGPLDAEASRKTLGDDDISHFIDTINVDDFIARPFSPAQDPSAGSFGYVPIFFSMEGSSSHRSSTCSSQGSCSGSSTSQVRQGWRAALLLVLLLLVVFFLLMAAGQAVCCMSHSPRNRTPPSSLCVGLVTFLVLQAVPAACALNTDKVVLLSPLPRLFLLSAADVLELGKLKLQRQRPCEQEQRQQRE